MQPPTLLPPPTPLTIPRDARAPATARKHARAIVASFALTPDQVDAVELIVSELVSNSVQHARSSDAIRLVIEGRDTAARIEVHDACRRPPALAPTSQEAESGRGLRLVAALSSAWGWDARPFGKSVWAEVKA